MSYVDSEHKKSYVITYKELVFTFVVFCIILFVLYPKDLLKEQILSENSNYDLSMLYLKNLLQHSPEDESLMLILAEQSLRSGKKDLSLRLLELLLKSKNKEHREKATLLSYELEKENYYYLENADEKVKQKKLLKDLFMLIYYGEMYNKDEIDKWYKESMFVNVDRATYFFLQKKLIKEQQDVDLLQQAYYFAKKFNYKNDALKYVKLLQKYDHPNRDKWILAEYHTHIQFKEYHKAEQLLKRYSDDSLTWKIRLAKFYLMTKSYKKSSKVYVELFNEARVYKEKREYFYQAVKALQAGNHLNAAARLVHRYENLYIHDINVRNFMLKIYMATGNLNYASQLSTKILQKELR